MYSKVALAALVLASSFFNACGSSSENQGASVASVERDGQCGRVSPSKTKERFILTVSSKEKYNLEATDGSSLNLLMGAAKSRKETCVFGNYAKNPVLVLSASDVKAPVRGR